MAYEALGFRNALILDLVCESFSFDEKDYYMEEKQKTSKTVTTNKMELGEEIRLLRGCLAVNAFNI